MYGVEVHKVSRAILCTVLDSEVVICVYDYVGELAGFLWLGRVVGWKRRWM